MGLHRTSSVALQNFNVPQTRRHFLGHMGNFLCAGALASMASLVPEEMLLGAESNPGINNREGDPWVLVPVPGIAQKPLVIVWGQGGPSHLDLFDPKPEAPEEYKGPFKAINTAVPGVQFTELLPEMASVANELRIVRCLSGNQAEHGMATALSTTGSTLLLNNRGDTLFNTPRYDSAQIKLSKELMKKGLGLVVLDSNAGREVYGGLQAKDSSSTLVQCNFDCGIYPSPFGNSADLERVSQVLELRGKFDRDRENNIYGQAGQRIDEVYASAQNVLGKNFCKAFDLTNVSPEIRACLGNSPAENSAIVAANLIKSGANLVILNMGFFDSHNNIEDDLKNGQETKLNKVSFLFNSDDEFFIPLQPPEKRIFIPGLGPTLDRVLKYLKDEIGEQAVIVFAGEFGRTPKMDRSGRDHWPNAYTMLMMGRGVEPAVIGETDGKGEEVISKEKYAPETVLESAINAAGYMRVKLRAGIIPESPERFPTQTGFENLHRNAFLAKSKI